VCEKLWDPKVFLMGFEISNVYVMQDDGNMQWLKHVEVRYRWNKGRNAGQTACFGFVYIGKICSKCRP
jgi:predicted lipoprotein with Yx(FWY)xxD motif